MEDRQQWRTLLGFNAHDGLGAKYSAQQWMGMNVKNVLPTDLSPPLICGKGSSQTVWVHPSLLAAQMKSWARASWKGQRQVFSDTCCIWCSLRLNRHPLFVSTLSAGLWLHRIKASLKSHWMYFTHKGLFAALLEKKTTHTWKIGV